MFEREYVFRGKHAEFVKDLTGKFGGDGKYQILSRNLDVFLLAPIIGFIYKRQGKIDSSLNSEGKNENTKIFLEQMLRIKDEAIYNYRLIMLRDKKYESSMEMRIEKAFKNIGTPEGEKDLEHFNSYILGGVEVLYEKIMLNAKNSEDYILNILEFMTEFENENNDVVDILDII
ncbi:hypothetical protein [Fusobacterium sp.]|uniref:hypothetical protein n=1 Tax=unclassified Fusobacterium TaxID=2648384 RepID=UPI0026290CEB|nr:hypothetical protein [Fusobacterium sp.]